MSKAALEKAGVQVAAVDEDARTLFLVLPGNVRAEISMARTERHLELVTANAGTPLALGGRQQKTVLAHLLLEARAVNVTRERTATLSPCNRH